MIFEIEDIKLVSLNSKFVKIKGIDRIATSFRYKQMMAQLVSLFILKKTNKEPLSGDISTCIEIQSYKDIDNCIKPIHDALEQSGVIKNDRNITKTNITKIPIKKGGNESLKVMVTELKQKV